MEETNQNTEGTENSKENSGNGINQSDMNTPKPGDIPQPSPIEPKADTSGVEVPKVPESPSPYAPPSTPVSSSMLNLSGLKTDLDRLRTEIQKYLIGQHDMVDLLLIGILADGHILLEGVPGIAKTLTSKLLSKTIKVDFSRIQFTPDLMPSDVVGTSVFNMKKSEFEFKKGPIFSNIVLIDEINRAPAKTQAALFEVMEERQVTMDGETYKMDYPFLIVATQNPVEQEGTYRLPEAQLDRFLFRVKLDYPSLTEEQQILQKFKQSKSAKMGDISQVLTADAVKKHRDMVDQVRVEDSIIKYISQITIETRNHGKLYLGGSPRASLSMMHASKAFAAMRGRDFVIPDDVQFVAPHVLNHRIILNPEAEMEGIMPKDIIEEIIKKVEVPR